MNLLRSTSGKVTFESMSDQRNTSKTSRIASDHCEDRISKLPKDVIDAILRSMPLKDVVRTSVLSRGWRYRWTSIPYLMFDKRCFSSMKKFSMIVSQVLLVHHGPLCGLRFYFDIPIDDCTSSDVNRWILCASRKGIKEFRFMFQSRTRITKLGPYRLPSCLFSCEMITCLTLHLCKLIPPDSFRGFPHLKKLSIAYCDVSSDVLELLISNSLCLKQLEIKDRSVNRHLVVSAPKLVQLFLGFVSSVHLVVGNLPRLATASIGFLRNPDITWNGLDCSLMNVISSIPTILELKLLADAWMTIARGTIPPSLPVKCQLKFVKIEMNLEDAQQVLAVLSLLRSTPCLQKLHLMGNSKRGTALEFSDNFWEEQDNHSCMLSSLRTGKVTGITGINHDLKFIGYILANAPVLERLEIEIKEDAADRFGIAKQLNLFQRRSPNAKVLL